MPTTDLEPNKANVIAFYDLMFNQSQPAEAIERHSGASYTQHNPHVADGKQAFIDHFERMGPPCWPMRTDVRGGAAPACG